MIRRQPFGKTGHNSSVTLFGAAALGNVKQEEADKTLNLLLNYGVNHIDTAASYGDSELRIGPWMEKHRNDFFLATKTEMRTYESAKKEFNDSLERLRVKNVDLLQLHNLVHPDDWSIAFGKDGVIEAAIEAKENGLTRLIGVTGHGLIAPAMHMRSLEKYEFDSVLLPYNYILFKDERYRRDFNMLLNHCKDRGIAVQTTKSLTLGPWTEKPHTANTWYEPLENQEDIDRAVSWILGQGSIFLNTSGDVRLLPKILDAASRRKITPSDEAMEEMVHVRKMSRLFVS